MKKCFFVVLYAILFFSFGCKKHKSIKGRVDLSSYDSVGETTMFENLKFTDSINFYQVRYASCKSSDYKVLFTNGDRCLGVEDSIACFSEVDTTQPTSVGFHRDCAPSCCHHYLITEKNGIIKTWSSTSELKKLLGKIDTPNEALLWVFAYGYYFIPNDKKDGAIKTEKDGYSIICLKLINECAPHQVDRFLLNVLRDGTVNIDEQELYDKNNHPCP